MDGVPAKESRITRLCRARDVIEVIGLPAIWKFEPLIPGTVSHHRNGAHLGGEGSQRDPSGDHEASVTGFPAAALGVPMKVVGGFGASGFFPKKLIEPKADRMSAGSLCNHV